MEKMKRSSEQAHEVQKAREILSPINVPEIAFQSYEQLKNNSSELFEGFLSGDFRNPQFEYPLFEEEDYLEVNIEHLIEAKNQALSVESSQFNREIISSTLDYRIAEHYYVKDLAEIQKKSMAGLPVSSIEIEKVRQLNESLYGRPNPEVTDGILNQIWSVLDSKNFSGEAVKIYDELKNGFISYDKELGGLPRAESPDSRLPDLEHNESLKIVGEYILEQNADLEYLVRDLWAQKMDEYGESYQAGPQEIIEFFENALILRDPNHESGVEIKLDQGAKNLSWNSAELAVMVGDERLPITNPEEMFKKILHEFGVHGQRAINGLKTDLPVLGSGLFTDTMPADYLTFEEGLATTLEAAVSNNETKWSPAKMGLYLNIALAEKGFDFRDIFEVSWRYRVLFNLKENQKIDQEMIVRHQKKAYDAAVRVFRGNPTDLSNLGENTLPLTYNKDLAYLNGRLSVVNYFNELYSDGKIDEDKVNELFLAKYDPTISEQAEIVRRVFNKEELI